MTEGSPLESGCEVVDDPVIKRSGLINQGFLYWSDEMPSTRGGSQLGPPCLAQPIGTSPLDLHTITKTKGIGHDQGHLEV